MVRVKYYVQVILCFDLSIQILIIKIYFMYYFSNLYLFDIKIKTMIFFFFNKLRKIFFESSKYLIIGNNTYNLTK